MLSIYLSLSLCLSLSLSLCLCVSVSLCLCVSVSLCLCVSVSVCLAGWLAGCLPTWLAGLAGCLSVCLSASLKTKLFCEMSSGFELDNIKNAAILRDFPDVWTWQRQKRRNSARLLHFSKLTTSKTKQFCETSSVFELNNVKTKQFCETSSFFKLKTSKRKQFCETSFKNGKLSAELTASYQCVLRFSSPPVWSNVPATKKVMPGHTKCCTCHAKAPQQTWKSQAPKCNP